jgi:hypothetical protein
MRGNLNNLKVSGYVLNAVAGSQTTFTDGQTLYWGSVPVAPGTTGAEKRLYFPKKGRITAAIAHLLVTTVGTAEDWSVYLRINNTTDYLIQTLALAQAFRLWAKYDFNIPVVAGDYCEIKEIQPTWATNPAVGTRAGVIYVSL